MDKIISLIAFLLLSMLGFFIFLDFFNIIKLMTIILILGFIFLFFIISNQGRFFIKKYILRKYSTKFEGFSNFLFFYFKNKKLLLLKNLIFTFLKWLVNSFSVYIIFLAYQQDISIIYVLLINSMLMIVSLIPISISGLGIGQSAAVFLYQNFFNIDSSLILSAYLIPLVIAYFIGIIVIIFNFKRRQTFGI